MKLYDRSTHGSPIEAFGDDAMVFLIRYSESGIELPLVIPVKTGIHRRSTLNRMWLPDKRTRA